MEEILYISHVPAALLTLRPPSPPLPPLPSPPLPSPPSPPPLSLSRSLSLPPSLSSLSPLSSLSLSLSLLSLLSLSLSAAYKPASDWLLVKWVVGLCSLIGGNKWGES